MVLWMILEHKEIPERPLQYWDKKLPTKVHKVNNLWKNKEKLNVT